MKRLILILFSLIIMGNVAFAGAADDFLENRSKAIGVVIVGSNDFKTGDYYEYINEVFTGEDKRYSIRSGDAVQTKYQEYWFEKGFLEEQTPNKDSLLDFAKFSGYGKVLYLIVEDPRIEVDNRSRSIGWLAVGVDNKRANVQVRAFLCSGDEMIKMFSSTKEDDSETSELRAKRGAFLKCLKDIEINLRPYLGKTPV